MPLSRKAISAALFARLKASVTLVGANSFYRKWKQPQEIGADQQPALLLLEGGETPDDQPPLPPEWTLDYLVVVYVRTNDLEIPGDLLADILDQVEGALELKATDGIMPTRFHTTLGLPKTVQRAWISGPVDKEDGSLTAGQGWLQIPISVIAIP